MVKPIRYIQTFFIKLLTGKKVWGKPTQYPITYAFTFDGVDYYQYENVFNLPYQRAFTAIAIYDEFSMRMTREVLEHYIAAQEAIINSPTIKLTDFAFNIKDMRDRLEWVFEPDTVLKLASVVYFTKEENPANYDVVYNSKKIKEWKRSAGVMLDFFLQVPLQELCPFLTQPPEVIQDYLKGSLVTSLQQLKSLLKVLSQGDYDEQKLASLRSKIAEYEVLTSML